MLKQITGENPHVLDIGHNQGGAAPHNNCLVLSIFIVVHMYDPIVSTMSVKVDLKKRRKKKNYFFAFESCFCESYLQFGRCRGIRGGVAVNGAGKKGWSKKRIMINSNKKAHFCVPFTESFWQTLWTEMESVRLGSGP
jgi:hypothetical protein